MKFYKYHALGNDYIVLEPGLPGLNKKLERGIIKIGAPDNRIIYAVYMRLS